MTEESNIIPLYRTGWTDRFALDVALTLEGSGDPLPELLAHYNMDADDMRLHYKDPVFVRRVTHFREDIRENGLGFRLKAKVQAEELLSTSWNLIHDHGVSPSVKADLIKSTVKWAGLEPKTDVLGVGVGGGGVRININFVGNQNQAVAIDGETYEHDEGPFLEDQVYEEG